MSCRILLDVHDTPNINHNSNHPSSSRRAGIDKFSISTLTRTIFCRRIRLLKFYMGALVILLFLFLIFKTTHDTVTSHPDQIEQAVRQHPSSPSVESSLHDDDHDDGKPLITAKIPTLSKQLDFAQLDNLVDVPPARKSEARSGYSTSNFTYLLHANDFVRMKNVNMMQVRIREAAKHSWDNYRRYAWGQDMLKPRSKEADRWFDLGLTIVEAADTLVIMGLTRDSQLALDWMENDLKFTVRNENSNCFELTIRILAGLLSAYHLTGREKLKQQAVEFGDILLHCYDTESKIVPYSDIDLNSHKAHPPQWNPHSSLSEVASLQLEFRYLSKISGNPIYEDTTFQTSLHIHNLTQNRKQKLLPMYINPINGQLEDSVITVGARSDSYYEYLLKQYIQTGLKWLEQDYLDSIDEVNSKLIRHTNGLENYTYVAEMQIYKTVNDADDIRYYNKMDHLVCFLPGTLALGYYHFSPQAGEYRLKYNLETPSERLNSRFDSHLEISQSLARTCYHMYKNMGTGLSAEIATFVHSQSDDPLAQNQPELQVQSSAAHNLLRPEYVESIFYLYHITGLPKYRDQARQIFESFQKYSRIPSGYSAISDVRIKPEPNTNLDESLHRHAPDRMESFWLSETLKYLYLIFCDDKQIVGTLLNNYIFNTEGHLIPIV